MDRRGAFTLIELLVVIAIIALLMSILMPSLRAAKEQALRVRCTGNLRDIGRALYMYADTYDSKLPPGSFQGENAPWLSYTAYTVDVSSADVSSADSPSVVSGPRNLAYLYEAKLCDNGEIFYCPSARHISDAGIRFQIYDSYNSPGCWPSNNIEQGNPRLVRTGYMYFPQSKTREDMHGWNLPKYTGSLNDVTARYTAVTELIHLRRLLPHCYGKEAKGVNALFGDGHVNFSTNQEAFADELWADNPGNNPMNFRLILSKLDP
jgi:prepilin-type N-terminal cleavage/methylation domain-containing protein/prepilin-type processing-associated H-X9-DG protein